MKREDLAPLALHDIANSLTVMLAWLDEASAEKAPPDFVQQALVVASKKAREAHLLARVALGDNIATDGQVSVADLLRNVITSLTPAFERRQLHVSNNLNEIANTLQIRGDFRWIHAVTNVLLNAVAFSPLQSTLTIRVVDNGQSVQVIIADEGPGVAPEQTPHIFSGKSTRPNGHGLGLQHAQHIAALFGGNLVYVPPQHRTGEYAQFQRHGALFSFTMQRFKEEPCFEFEPTPRSIRPVSLTLAGMNILIVEDDRQVCSLLELGLSARGGNVHVALDNNVFLQAISVHPYHAILLDLSPIVHNLSQSLTLLRHHQPNAGIVFISGSATLRMEHDLYNAAPHAQWVRKPFSVQEVAEAIHAVVFRVPLPMKTPELSFK